MSVGSGSSKVGSCGEVPEVYFYPVEVNAPESLMNTANAAMPLARGFQKLWEGEFAVFTSELRPLGFVSVAWSDDVLACLQGFSAFTVDALLGKNCFRNSPVYVWPVLCFEFNRLLRKIWGDKTRL